MWTQQYLLDHVCAPVPAGEGGGEPVLPANSPQKMETHLELLLLAGTSSELPVHPCCQKDLTKTQEKHLFLLHSAVARLLSFVNRCFKIASDQTI